MKLACGTTYKEAVTNPPWCGLKKTEVEQLALHRFPIVLSYKDVIKVGRYRWVRAGQFCVRIQDKTTGELVLNSETGKLLSFKSIKQAMIWVYDQEKEKYDEIKNLSTYREDGEQPNERRTKEPICEELFF